MVIASFSLAFPSNTSKTMPSPKPINAAVGGSLTNSADPRQDTSAYAFEPPTYDEAIGFASDQTAATQWNVRLAPCDELQGAEAYDMEDEQDYEESRPLRTGVIPNAPSHIDIPAISPATSYAPPNVPPPPLLQQLPTYQRPAEPFAGIPAVQGNHGLMNAQDISIADFVRKCSGDESVDPILESDPYQLYRYFVAHNDRPEMYLLITGYHVEKRETAVQWDYEELTRAIIHAIRSAHYRFNVEVSFPLKNDRVKVASSSPLAKFMRNPWTKAFCFLGVVGVVFYPIVRTVDMPLHCNEA
ncbi:hypothetical protein BGZ82_005475 [Podila clonocystis]|nr:hypothetical protein BGZ82_005475 [Podila clonocystis]